MAANLKKEPDTKVELVEGGHGEFTVTVDGHLAAQKGDSMAQVLDAVRHAGPVAAGR